MFFPKSARNLGNYNANYNPNLLLRKFLILISFGKHKKSHSSFNKLSEHLNIAWPLQVMT